MTDTSFLPIKNEQLNEFTQRANALLAKVEWQPKPGVTNAKPTPENSTSTYRESSLSPATTESVSLLKLARAISRDEALLSSDVNHAMQVVREGMKIGMYLSKLYTESSGLDRLIEQNQRGGLADAQKAEFRGKYTTASLITVFITAYYVVAELADYKAEDLGNLQLDFQGVPEVSLQNPVRALQCLLFYYGMYIDSPSVKTDLEFVKMTQIYFQAVLDELKTREASFEYTEAFTNQSYKLEHGDFHVRGFEIDTIGGETSMEFNRVELSSIVGNREAKHSARRLVERLLCYDLETKRNPFNDLGGFATLRMGYGKPGTGKSLQIAATATMLSDYCKTLNIPFLFWPMPDTIVSTFQGGSAERMVAWMKPLRDSSKIIYAPIDDGENNLEDRTRQGVSAGVREVIGVFLRYTEGAYALNHGNTAIEIFTNLPDQIDKAVLSRIVARFAIDGAEKWEDFLDQDHLWWRKYQNIDPAFIAMNDPKEYTYLAAQALLSSVSALADESSEPKEESIRVVFDKIKSQYDIKEHLFFAELYKHIHEAFPFFTSRDVRNIQQAVNNRIMDFEFPEGWFDDPALFFSKDYDTKKNMLTELMKDNMKGLSFADVRLQEAVKYLDNMVRIASVTRDQQIDKMVEDILMRDEVAKRVAAKDSRL
jgi:ATPase family associated with various cellular activities (AAA)